VRRTTDLVYASAISVENTASTDCRCSDIVQHSPNIHDLAKRNEPCVNKQYTYKASTDLNDAPVRCIASCSLDAVEISSSASYLEHLAERNVDYGTLVTLWKSFILPGMVYHGPSRGCNPCRKRRVKCDEARPFCGSCVRRKQQHVCAYRNLFDAVHKDSHRYAQESSPSSSSSGHDSSDSPPDSLSDQYLTRYGDDVWYLRRRSTPPPLFAPAADPELDSLCFFFNNYVNLPRVSQSNIFIQHVLPLWKQAPENSPLKFATSATAANLSELWRMKGPDSELARAKYGKALTSLRQSFEDPNNFNSDETLGTMFMLDFYESLNRRFQHATDIDVHQKAAMALLQSRGRASFKTETSRRLFTALRARYILFNLQAKRKVDLPDELLQEDNEIDFPGEKLDLIVADLANLMYEGRHLLESGKDPFSAGSSFPVAGGLPSHSPEPTRNEVTLEALLSYLLEINLRLNGWRQSLPPGWAAHRIPNASQSLHHSIRAVGLYNGLCDVYASTGTAHSHNGWRSTKVLVLRLINHCLHNLDPSSPLAHIMPDPTIALEIQGLVDGICASVPFHLGSRTTLALPHEHHEYPPVPAHVRAAANYVDSTGRPTSMSDNDHIRSAAAIGGWFVLTPLTAMMRYAQPSPQNRPVNTTTRLAPLVLRPGQVEWITGQVRRIHKMYRIPLPRFPQTGEVSRLGGSEAASPESREDEQGGVGACGGAHGWPSGGSGRDAWVDPILRMSPSPDTSVSRTETGIRMPMSNSERGFLSGSTRGNWLHT
jgi:Fungal Zn(2)-Cys(6) binuclear cluster domain